MPSNDLLRRLRGRKLPVMMGVLGLALVIVLVRQHLPLLAVALPLALALVLIRPRLKAHPVSLRT